MSGSPEPRLRKAYNDQVVEALLKRFNYKSKMQVPRLQRIVINMGLGTAVGNPKVIDSALAEMTAIAGQKPVVTRAKKSIAGFKLREGMPIGVAVRSEERRVGKVGR